MGKYRVTYRIAEWGVEDLEADSPEEAIDIVAGMDYLELFEDVGLVIQIDDVVELEG